MLMFVIALVVGALIGGFALWMRGKGIATTWYDWLIIVVAILLLVFAVQNFFASQIEGEGDAAPLFLLVAGLPALILLALVWQLVVRRNKTA
jgi:uncharacterized membrane protein YhaH (DUF805 family)